MRGREIIQLNSWEYRPQANTVATRDILKRRKEAGGRPFGLVSRSTLARLTWTGVTLTLQERTTLWARARCKRCTRPRAARFWRGARSQRAACETLTQQEAQLRGLSKSKTSTRSHRFWHDSYLIVQRKSFHAFSRKLGPKVRPFNVHVCIWVWTDAKNFVMKSIAFRSDAHEMNWEFHQRADNGLMKTFCQKVTLMIVLIVICLDLSHPNTSNQISKFEDQCSILLYDDIVLWFKRLWMILKWTQRDLLDFMDKPNLK